ncbi:MAG: hypothetical protein ACLP66_24395 [Polyangia bacterium]
MKRIIDLAGSGQALWPYTSKKTRKPGYDDDLLNHWGIVHFHLGDTFDANGYAARTNALLYVRVSVDDLYLLGIYHHCSFQESELLNIAIRNWPESLEPFRLIGVSIGDDSASQGWATSGGMKRHSRSVLMHPTRAVPAARTKEFRGQGLNATFEAESGAHYYPPGGGYSCAGTSVLSGIHADHEIWWAEQMASMIEAEISQVATRLSDCTSHVDVHELRFHLRSLAEMKNGLAVEENTNCGIQLPKTFDHSFNPMTLVKCMAAALMATRR